MSSVDSLAARLLSATLMFDRVSLLADSGRAGQPCKETNFADQFALCDLGDRANRISFVYRKARIAFANQDLTASQDPTAGFGSQSPCSARSGWPAVSYARKRPFARRALTSQAVPLRNGAERQREEAAPRVQSSFKSSAWSLSLVQSAPCLRNNARACFGETSVISVRCSTSSSCPFTTRLASFFSLVAISVSFSCIIG
jgi:hypothetical protein